MRVYKATVEAVKHSLHSQRPEFVCRWDHSDHTFVLEPPEHVPLMRDILIRADGMADGEPINPQYLGLAPGARITV